MQDRRTGRLLGGVCLLLLLVACELNLPGPPGGGEATLTPSSQSADGSIAAPTGEGEDAPRMDPARMTPLLLALLGLALFAITGLGVFLAVRGRPRTSRSRERRPRPTERPRVMAESGDLLAEGTVLGEGRFLVVRALGSVEGEHLYEVKPTSSTLLCSQCYAPQTGSAPQTGEATALCERCGAPLAQRSSPAGLHARETLDPQRYAVSAELLTDQLAHPAVIIPVSVFADGSFGALRYYQVEPLVDERRAAKLRRPQPVEQVLAWGIDLADGLAYLHDHDVVLEEVTLERVIVQAEAFADEGASADQATSDGAAPYAGWLCFDGVSVVQRGNGDGRVEREAANVRGLARLLMQLSTDDDVARAASTLPQGLQRTLSQAVGSHGLLRAADFAVALKLAREQLAQQQEVRFLVGQQSDVGHVRTLNEDSLWVMASPSLPSVGAFVVADGVGGHAAGDVASRLAVEAIARHGDDLQRARADGDMLDAEAWLTRAAKAANQAVYTERQAAANDMGCTLVMALMVGRAATVLNVGDSRAYRLNPKGMYQITTDHSLVQRLIDIGQLSPEEARHHPQKSVIYRVIGDSPDLAMDLFHVTLLAGEALLLCSDGLSDMVVDDVIWQVWREAASPQAACDRLVALAKEAGGYDNITVVLVGIA